MSRFVRLLTAGAAILMAVGFGFGLTHFGSAQAKDNDPEGVFRGFVAALSNGDAASATALLDADFRFEEPNGSDSFAVIGKTAFGFAIDDIITNSGFKPKITSARVHGDTVTGGLSSQDKDTKAAGLDRYLETFTATVTDGKLTSLHLLYVTSDAQTAKYIEYQRASDNQSDSPAKFAEVTLDPGSGGSQPGHAFIGEAAPGTSFVGIEVEPGASGVQQSAHLHLGSCANPGAVVYTLADIVGHGSGTIISASFDEIMAMGLSLDVHQAGQTDRVNACGEVVAAPAPAPAAAPAPSHTDIKPPATGSGPAQASRLPSLLFAAIATGVLSVMAGIGIRRRHQR